MTRSIEFIFSVFRKECTALMMSAITHNQSVWSPYVKTRSQIDSNLPKLCEKSRITSSQSNSSCPLRQVSTNLTPVNHRVLTAVSGGLTFGEDVLQERCSHLLPYDAGTLRKILNPSSLLESRTKYKGQRRQNRHPVAEAPPKCSYLKTTSLDRDSLRNSDLPAKPLVINSAGSGRKTNRRSELKSEKSTSLGDFRSVQPNSETVEWDEYLMNVLSTDTARWVVHHRLTDEETRCRLAGTLDALYGPLEAEDGHPELVRDDVSDTNVPIDTSNKNAVEKTWPRQQDV